MDTGAGMSADSDIATFRSRSSSTETTTPTEVKKQTSGNLMRLIPLEDACYQTKPEKAWFYDAGYREAIMQSGPHEGYDCLLQLLEHFMKPYFIITTNIDRYFAKGGFSEELLFETHGSVEALQCSRVGLDRCPGVWLWPDDTPLPVLNKIDLTCTIDTGKVPPFLFSFSLM